MPSPLRNGAMVSSEVLPKLVNSHVNPGVLMSYFTPDIAIGTTVFETKRDFFLFVYHSPTWYMI